MKKFASLIVLIAFVMSLSLGAALAQQQTPPADQQQGSTWVCPRTGQTVQASACVGCGQHMRHRGAGNCPRWQNSAVQNPQATGVPANQGNASSAKPAGAKQ